MRFSAFISDNANYVNNKTPVYTDGTSPMTGIATNLMTNAINNESGNTNHCLELGKSQHDYVNWYEYGATWNFYKSQAGTNTLIATISEAGIRTPGGVILK